MSVSQVREAFKKQLLQIPGVIGIGQGSHIPGEPAHLWLYLREHVPEAPDQILGVPVLKIIAGDVRAFSTILIESPRLKYRPYPGGISIGTTATFKNSTFTTTGTLGMAVKDALTGEKLLLSNNHVFAWDTFENNGAMQGRPIIQPGDADGGINDQIATLHRWVKLPEIGSTTIDCALAKPLNQNDVRDDILGIGTPGPMGEAQPGMMVQKSGRTTGLTQSKVLDVHATIQVSYGSFTTFFEDCIVIDNPNQSFGAPGDSGSMIMNGLTPVGLLFSGSDSIIVASKIQNVARALGITIAGVPAPPSMPLPLTWLSIFAGVGLGIFLSRK